jgi:hypothetical protein
MTPAESIHALARRYRLRRWLATFALGAGIGLVTLALARRSEAPLPVAAFLGAAAAALAIFISRRFLGSVADIAIARHLDRSVPLAEESAELLLRPESELTLFERLQRRRVEASLAGVALPRPGDRRAARAAFGATAALLAAVALLLLPGRATLGRAPDRGASRSAESAPALAGASVEIRPPRYTGRPVREQQELEIEAEEGSEIRWTLTVTGEPAAPRIVTSAGDTIALRATDGGAYGGRLSATRSLLYQVVIDSTPDAAIHRLVVRADAAPQVTVLRPAPRSELTAGTSLRVPVEVQALDDHGVASAELVATVTTGSGESVRFREQRVALPAPRRAPGGSTFRAELDLGALGMAPGDELYFHVVAFDHRTPVRNRGRSATVFLSLADTASATPALMTGVSLPVAPEYFRSQRQIIIDTERLIADAARLPTEIFRERSNAIGMDQGLLRLRYGEFTGEEFEEEVVAGQTHAHDSEENATLLATSVKATLKAAIAEMWEAELRLRTYRPAEALPFEHRALELLKSVQQASRAYVQRVGFEPPPLEVDRRRLTGNVAGVRSRALADSSDVADDRSATRMALEVVRELAAGAAASTADRALLAAAEDELAPLAVEGSERHFEALRRVRLLRAALRDGNGCDACLTAAEGALLASLPEPPPGAAPGNGGGRLARRYLEFLGGSP